MPFPWHHLKISHSPILFSGRAFINTYLICSFLKTYPVSHPYLCIYAKQPFPIFMLTFFQMLCSNHYISALHIFITPIKKNYLHKIIISSILPFNSSIWHKTSAVWNNSIPTLQIRKWGIMRNSNYLIKDRKVIWR